MDCLGTYIFHRDTTTTISYIQKMSTFEERQEVALFALRDSFTWNEEVWPSTKLSLADLCALIPGIGCNSGRQRMVTSIDWTSRDLEGTIPSEIGHLTRLERLKLGNNHLYGSIPSTLSKLTMLEHLELYRNDLTGTLPWLAGMVHLKRFLAQSNHLEGTLSDSLCGLSSLHGLTLFENWFNGSIPDCFGNMSLETFQIEQTRLTGTLPSWLCDRIGLDCALIACPMYTYQPTKGRQSEFMECIPCPTAKYLGSTFCPDAIVDDLESNATPNPTKMPSLPATATIRTVVPVQISTISPTAEPLRIWETLGPSTSSSTWNDNGTENPKPFHPIVITNTPSSVPSLLSYSTMNPQIGPFFDSRDTSAPQSSYSMNRTLMAVAFLMSALALLTVVLARRKHRRWWYVRPPPIDDRKEGEEEEDDPPISALAIVTSNFLDQRPNSTLSQSTGSRRSVGPGPTRLDELGVITRSIKNDQDNESIESDSGWNDTESSVDDSSDTDSSGEAKEESHHSSLYPWGSYFTNPLVPV